jgi:cytochrome P450
MEGELRRCTVALLDAVPDGEPVDFLVDVAAEPLPLQMICPVGRRRGRTATQLFAWSNRFDFRATAPNANPPPST